MKKSQNISETVLSPEFTEKIFPFQEEIYPAGIPCCDLGDEESEKNSKRRDFEGDNS